MQQLQLEFLCFWVRMAIKRRGKVLSMKLRQDKELIYKTLINFEDFKQLATLLSDLEMYGADVEKAIEEYKREKQQERKFPPW